jgi:DNA-binding Lrp family transcriptional regulator
MKLERLNEALCVAQEFGLDGTDVTILFAIAEKRRDEGAATIMQFSSGTKFASFGTIHARVKRMVQKGILKKQVKEGNERVKVLQDGPALGKFLDRLNEV